MHQVFLSNKVKDFEFQMWFLYDSGTYLQTFRPDFSPNFFFREKRRGLGIVELFVYCSASFIFAIGAFFFTDSMPFTQLSFDA